MSTSKRALIVGSGVAGLSAAIGLRRAGFEVDLIDIEPTLSTLGSGLTLTGGTLRALDTLGVLDRVRTEGACGYPSSAYDGDGRFLYPMPGGVDAQTGLPYNGGIRRTVLQRILAEQAEGAGARLSYGRTWTALQQGDDRVHVTFNDGQQASYDLVVGADGLRSKMRAMLFPDAPQPRFSGQGCWRVVVPRPEGFNGAAFLGRASPVGVNPLAADAMYLFLLQHVPHNPHMPEDQWPQLLKEQLQGFGGAVAEIREQLGPQSAINYRPLEYLLMPAPWYRGRILLIGDAVHAPTPQIAHGAGLGIEDGIVLGEVLRSAASVDAALDAFMARRFERCSYVVNAAVRLGDMLMAHASPQDIGGLIKESGEYIMRPI